MTETAPLEGDCREDALCALRTRFPNTTFLALGQTALWDEPTKATLRRRLDHFWPEASILAGVHDTDYFAKLHGFHQPGGEAFALVGHDDHKTRALWSAAGEMSQLFGSEDVPTRDLLLREAGVSLKKALAFADDPDALLSELTMAWGWTGILHAGWERQISAEVKLAEILPTLTEQIRWATEGSAVGQTLIGWVEEFSAAHPDALLPCLYQYLLPRLYEQLLGALPQNFATTRTTTLLRFNTETCSHPRFWLVQAFLDPATRAQAREAYDLAVEGGEQYTLDQFGPGARPFDLVVPGRGRGTLRVRADGSVWIDTPDPIHLPGEKVITSVRQLAERIESALGPDCVLIGKAVALLPMLTAEWVLVFHEGASGYSWRSARLMAELRRLRVSHPTLRPILRITYHTWDSLSAAPGVRLTLPEHLTQALGRQTLDADDFAACWRRGSEWESRRLTELAGLRSPKSLLAYLERHCLLMSAAEYARANNTLQLLWEQARTLRDHERSVLTEVRQLRATSNALEHAKGDDFRARGSVLDDAAVQERRERFDLPLAQNRRRVRQLLLQAKQLHRERVIIERSPRALAARTTLRRIEAEAEIAKARLAKNALQTVHGLPHTEKRPSAWWFPQVDPSGRWFNQVADTAELRLEELV
ncbi:hypothetical protein [Armatimonas rosea]|uniref:Uncharacterized protein n=1 Tax=Armatimonas rosea TaxID=685828 RepID=A0A7W9SSN7_ARMRO|nr:hypothetical protein [Armatimonas rosea]MBB6052137.1 hypothetical protein [Armatimonas rosea]